MYVCMYVYISDCTDFLFLPDPISENAPAPAPALMRSAGNVANTSPRGKTNVQKRSPSLSLAAEEKVRLPTHIYT